jgi:hypothetical protein
MSQNNFDFLQSWLCQEAIALTGYPNVSKSAAYQAMTNEPDLLLHWWDGAFEQSESETALLDSAARAFAHRRPLPELSLAQRGWLALRLRLASRFLRALRNKSTTQTKKWFPAKLHKFSEPELLEWLLVDAAPICLEMLDETLEWVDEFPDHPPGRSMKRPPQKLSSGDSASFSA